MKKTRKINSFLSIFFSIFIALSLLGTASAASLPQDEPPETEGAQIEVISPYYSVEYLTTADGQELTRSIINGPSSPLPEYEEERQASITSVEPQGTLANFPSYNWVFGCSAVSGAMISAWYDRGSYPNMYSGPTNSGVMPLTDSGWQTWTDGYETYPSNPLVASRNGLDGRASKGTIEDYWVKVNSAANDPYITGGWTQHTWGTAIGDYMKTSQSAIGNHDGETTFYTWTNLPDKLTCADMNSNDISFQDGTYGRKLFYEARGYTVTDCYNQKTSNNSGGFTLANFQAEIDAGHPVMLNLDGHTIVGYGYNGSTIYIRDTWDSNPANVYTMPWGGSYQGMNLLSVSVVHLKPITLTGSKVFLPMIVKPVPIVVNPFLNPGFESGAVSWAQSSTNNWDLIYSTSDAPISAHGGSWLAWLGGGENETSVLSQTITISAVAPYLHFWYYIASNDTCGYDYFYVGVNGSYFYSETLCSNNSTGGWVQKVLNLSAYVGSNKTVQFRVITDGSDNSNLFLDDVSMSASAVMAQGEAIEVERYPGAASETK